jgi:hypothetical protein
MKLTDNYMTVILSSEDRELSLQIGFFGYTQKMVENYLTKTFINSTKPHAQKWDKMKYL